MALPRRNSGGAMPPIQRRSLSYFRAGFLRGATRDAELGPVYHSPACRWGCEAILLSYSLSRFSLLFVGV